MYVYLSTRLSAHSLSAARVSKYSSTSGPVIFSSLSTPCRQQWIACAWGESLITCFGEHKRSIHTFRRSYVHIHLYTLYSTVVYVLCTNAIKLNTVVCLMYVCTKMVRDKPELTHLKRKFVELRRKSAQITDGHIFKVAIVSKHHLSLYVHTVHKIQLQHIIFLNSTHDLQWSLLH